MPRRPDQAKSSDKANTTKKTIKKKLNNNNNNNNIINKHPKNDNSKHEVIAPNFVRTTTIAEYLRKGMKDRLGEDTNVTKSGSKFVSALLGLYLQQILRDSEVFVHDDNRKTLFPVDIEASNKNIITKGDYYIKNY